jgi:hypothetical protein
MGEIVNLRRARKARARILATSEAAANRTKFGQSAAERSAAQTSRALESRRFEAHKREDRESSPDDHAD